MKKLEVKEELAKEKELKGRAGDWNCGRCENHNYSFRDYCNKCGLSKIEHEWMLKAPQAPEEGVELTLEQQ